MGVYRSPSRRRLIRFAVIAVILLAWMSRRSCTEETTRFADHTESLNEVDEAWKKRASGVWVELEGKVERILADDQEGSPHQRFVIRLPSSLTLLIVHNIELAPRVPVEVNDQVRVRGEYEWNQKGGLVHWTHHDPKGKLQGGWIRFREKEYR
jgi:hypothetical protein